MAGRDIRFVREYRERNPFQAEAWYYGMTKVKKHSIVIRTSVLEQSNIIEIFVAAPEPTALAGLLAELGSDLVKRLKAKGQPIQQITNITIKDSIINRSTLLFKDEHDFKIEDSIVSHANI